MAYSFTNQRPWKMSMGGDRSHLPASHILEFDHQTSSQQKASRREKFMCTVAINTESSSFRAHLGFPGSL